MNGFMEEKIKALEEYIRKLDKSINEEDVREAEELQTEIIAVYEAEIKSLKSELSNYSAAGLYDETYVDYIKDARLLRAKLINHKLNLATGLYNPFQNSEGLVNVTQHVNQDVSTNVVVNFEQAIHDIQELPETELSEAEKEKLLGKLAVISAEKDKKKRWEKIGDTLKWVGDKSIQVGIALLPYIAQAIKEA